MKKLLLGKHLVDGGFGDIVRSLRTIEGLTQDQVSQAYGSPRTTISNIECGRQNVNVDQMVELLRVLGYVIKIELERIGR